MNRVAILCVAVAGWVVVCWDASVRADEAQVRAALEKKISLAVLEVPLDQVAEHLSEKLQVNVRLNVRSINSIGVGVEIPVTLKLNDVPARVVLDRVTGDLDLS